LITYPTHAQPSRSVQWLFGNRWLKLKKWVKNFSFFSVFSLFLQNGEEFRKTKKSYSVTFDYLSNAGSTSPIGSVEVAVGGGPPPYSLSPLQRKSPSSQRATLASLAPLSQW
jgi:hypothetical protein